MPALAMGGGTLLLLRQVQDTLGRTSELAGVIPAAGEILWDLDEAAHVKVVAERDNLLLVKGETATGWVLTDAEVTAPGNSWDTPLLVGSDSETGGRPEGMCTSSLFCSMVFVHLAARAGIAPRFVRQCAAFAARHQ